MDNNSRFKKYCYMGIGASIGAAATALLFTIGGYLFSGNKPEPAIAEPVKEDCKPAVTEPVEIDEKSEHKPIIEDLEVAVEPDVEEKRIDNLEVVIKPKSEIPKDPKLYMTFDKDTIVDVENMRIVKDLSGNGNHGVIFGARQVGDEKGQALGYDGFDDHVVINGENLNIHDAITISAWIYPENSKLSNVIRKGNGPSGVYYLILVNDNVRLAINNNGWDHGGYKLPSINRWYHVVGTYDRNNRKIYVNGVLQDTIPQTEVINLNNYNVTIGQDGGGHEYFKGLIDEVLVYDRVLSEEEIQSLFKKDFNAKGIIDAYDKELDFDDELEVF